MSPPEFPAGAVQPKPRLTHEERSVLIAEIDTLPADLSNTVARLTDSQLDTLYKNWTIRQIVHHLADSHVNCYIRFKWTLTEDCPTIKAYHEGNWAALEDSRSGDIAAPLALLKGLHSRWVQLMKSMTDEQFDRAFIHPENGKTINLNAALSMYAWHGRHHFAQIQWLVEQNGW
jgi:hypothetical protein